MSLVFGSFIPNDPHIAINVLHKKESSAIVDAISEIEGELYFMNPDTIVLLTSHGEMLQNTITVHMTDSLKLQWPDNAHLPENTPEYCSVDVGFAARLKEQIDINSDCTLPVTVASEDELPIEVSAPLAIVMQHLSQTKPTNVVVISIGDEMSQQESYEFGKILFHHISDTNKRIAVIATGHFGEHENGPHAESLARLVESHAESANFTPLLQTHPRLLEHSGQDAMNPLSALMGVVDGGTGACHTVISGEAHGKLHVVANCHVQ